MFETTSDPKPAATIISSLQLIAQNTTLGQDKATLLRCWLAMGGKEDVLRRKYIDYDANEYKMRDEPSDDVSEWYMVKVEGG